MNTLLYGSDDGIVKVWSIEPLEELDTLRGHAETITSLCYEPNSEFIVSASTDETVKIWDSQTGICLNTLEELGHVSCVTCSYDGKYILAGSDRGLKVWDLHTLDLLFSYVAGTVEAVAVDPSVNRIAFVDDDADIIHFWAISTMTKIQSIGEGNFTTCIRFHPTINELVAASSTGTILIWDLDSMVPIHTLSGHGSFITDVCYSVDGTQLASASWDKRIILWDSSTGAQINSIEFHKRITKLVFTEDGTAIWFILDLEEHIYAWDSSTNSWELKHSIPGETVSALCLPYSSSQGGYVL